MTEPLNNSLRKPAFTGKTGNQHPHWQNQPLRLTKAQKKDPLPVLEEFFQSYHLKDFREIFWNWLSAVISNPNESFTGDDHLFFYEKVEAVIEVAFVMKKKMQKHRRREENRGVEQSDTTIQNCRPCAMTPALVAPFKETEEVPALPEKKKRLMEYVEANPDYVIEKVFSPDQWSFINCAIRDWLFIALAADSTIYETAKDRQALILFHDALLLFVEALFVNLLRDIGDPASKEELQREYGASLLSQEQKANPKEVIKAFFGKYPMTYIIRELEDWLEVAIDYSGPWRDNLTGVLHVLHTHRNVVCLVNAAEQLLHR
jgi:hypothetical protein